MAAKQDIHAFAVKWVDRFRNTKNVNREVEESTFADECFSLGFEMDCGKAFEATYPESKALNDSCALDKIIEGIDDIPLLCSAIFSKWRCFTHWDGPGEDVLSFESWAWFITALNRLERLSAGAETIPLPFAGSPKKIRLVSNNICYGPFPAPDDEVEQHLSLTANGRVFFSEYTYGGGIEYHKSRTKNFKIAPDRASYIVKIIADYFSDYRDVAMAADAGDWEMTLTNEDDVSYRFRGSLCSGCFEELDHYSDIIRFNLDMPELLVFDGRANSDRIEKVSIDYHRVTKSKLGGIPERATRKCATWDYSEHLTIDRKSETLEHIQNIGSGCQISRKYLVEDGISSLLDALDNEAFFAHTEGNPPDVVRNPLETKDYRITIDYLYGGQKVLTGTFDKNGLPDDFPDFAETVFYFMRFYGMGEILNPSVYDKALRKQTDFIFCNVQFEEYRKTYCYLTDDDTLEVGDHVIVPVGQNNHEAFAQIESIEYHPAEEAPFPIKKIKRIIGRAEEKEDGGDESIVFPEDAASMANEPLPRITPEEWGSMRGESFSDEELAAALARAWNKCGWLGHALEEDDCTPELKAEHDAWWTLEKELIVEIAKRMNRVCETPYVKLITPFMERNGYRDGHGWWVKKEDGSQSSEYDSPWNNDEGSEEE